MAKLKKILCLLPLLAISLSGMTGCTESEIDDTVPTDEGGDGNENEETSGSTQSDDGDSATQSEDEEDNTGSGNGYIDENGHDTSADLPEDTEHHEEHLVLPDLYLHENYDDDGNLIFTHEGEDGNHQAVTLSQFESEMGEVEIYVSTSRGLEGALELLRCVDYDLAGEFSSYAEMMGYGEDSSSDEVDPVDEGTSFSWKEHALNYAEILESESARTTNVTIEIDHDLDLCYIDFIEKRESSDGNRHAISSRSYSLVCDVPYVTIRGADDTEDQVILKVPNGVLINADDVTFENFILYGDEHHWWEGQSSESTYGPSEIVGISKGKNVILNDLIFSSHESWDHDRYTYDTFSYHRCITMYLGAESVTISGCKASGYILDGVVAEYLENGKDVSLTIKDSSFDDIIRYPLSVTLNHACDGTRSYPNSDGHSAISDEPDYSFSPYWFYNAETDYGYANTFRLYCEGSSFSGYVRVFNHRACVTAEDEDDGGDTEPNSYVEPLDDEEESTVISGPTEITPTFHECSFHFGLHDYKDNIYGIYETDADSHFSYCEFENIGLGEEYSIANDDRWESGAHRYLFAPATLTVHDSRGHIFETHRYSCTIGLYWPHGYRYAADGVTLQTSYYIGENNIYHHITYEWLEDIAPNEDPDKACGFYLHKDTSTETDENGNHLPGAFDTDNLFFPHEWDEDLVED